MNHNSDDPWTTGMLILLTSLELFVNGVVTTMTGLLALIPQQHMSKTSKKYKSKNSQLKPKDPQVDKRQTDTAKSFKPKKDGATGKNGKTE